ncbi:hypothetical protein PG985_007409 [Apiospora marii]|uniref:uncharacterized protein n=1 Tax=Apiospora marii TaxID=335849 RepID=UPI0031325536
MPNSSHASASPYADLRSPKANSRAIVIATAQHAQMTLCMVWMGFFPRENKEHGSSWLSDQVRLARVTPSNGICRPSTRIKHSSAAVVGWSFLGLAAYAGEYAPCAQVRLVYMTWEGD